MSLLNIHKIDTCIWRFIVMDERIFLQTYFPSWVQKQAKLCQNWLSYDSVSSACQGNVSQEPGKNKCTPVSFNSMYLYVLETDKNTNNN